MIHAPKFIRYFILTLLVSGCSEAGFEEELMDLFSEVPTSPMNLTALPGSNEVVLTWAPSPMALGHELLRSEISGSEYQSIARLETLNSGSYTDQNVQNGSLYFYVVRAYNSTGSSEFSNEAEATPMEHAASSESLFTIALSFTPAGTLIQWQALNSALKYQVLRSDTSGGPYTLLSEDLNETYFLDISVLSQSTYYYVVTALHSHGTSETSLYNHILTNDFSGPLAPSSFSADRTNQSILLTWKPAQGAVSYNLYRGTEPDAPLNYLSSTADASYSDTNSTDEAIPVYYEIASVGGDDMEGLRSTRISLDQ